MVVGGTAEVAVVGGTTEGAVVIGSSESAMLTKVVVVAYSVVV